MLVPIQRVDRGLVGVGLDAGKVVVCVGDGSEEVHAGDAGADGYVGAGEQLGVGTHRRTNPRVPARTAAPASPDPPTRTYPYSLPHPRSHILGLKGQQKCTRNIVGCLERTKHGQWVPEPST